LKQMQITTIVFRANLVSTLMIEDLVKYVNLVQLHLVPVLQSASIVHVVMRVIQMEQIVILVNLGSILQMVSHVYSVLMV
jgi:hypothetical protein